MMGCSKESGTCATCRSGCTRKPGWFLPGEAERAAEFMGVTLAEFFRQYLAVDWWTGDPDIFLLSPAVADAETGTEFPADPTGTCVFYQDGRCQIHPVKPHECRETWCGETEHSSTIHRDTAAAWADHQGQIRELLGRDPRATPYGILDLLGRL